MEKKIKKAGVIGAGVMGEALIAALIAYGVKPELITISEKRKDRADELVKRLRPQRGVEVLAALLRIDQALGLAHESSAMDDCLTPSGCFCDRTSITNITSKHRDVLMG